MKVLVWDAPTRLFHWLFALSFLVAWVSAESDLYRDVHVFSGYLFLGLLVFRLFWGFAGSRYARFGSFLFAPAVGFRYLRGIVARSTQRYLGHNPAGAWAIYLLLALGVVVSLTGILVLGGEEQHGIFTGFATFAGAHAVKEVHEVLATIMLWVVVGHIAGVLAESWAHRENLTKAMLTGKKEGNADDGIRLPHYFIGVVLFAAVAAFATWFFHGYLTQTAGRPYLPFVGQVLPDNKTWRSECGSCHLAYHPTLLPARSWSLVMQRQNDHFGESLDLDAAMSAQILAFLRTYSAEAGLTEAGFKINKSIPRDTSPMRITETAYWKKKHEEIPEGAWSHPKVGSKANCAACHLDAEKGTFEDAAMRLPEGIARVPSATK